MDFDEKISADISELIEYGHPDDFIDQNYSVDTYAIMNQVMQILSSDNSIDAAGFASDELIGLQGKTQSCCFLRFKTGIYQKGEKMSEIEIQAMSPINQAMQMVNNGGDIKNLEKMMELQERYDANEARKAYHHAMTDFKKSPPKITKSKHVKYGNTNYKHADLASITEMINSALSEQGLSAAWKTDQENNISVKCTITHVLGHSESTTLSSPPDNSGGKNSIQAIGSTITYLQRYTILALTGLAAHDQDDDGQEAQAKPAERKEITGKNKQNWENAKQAYIRDGNFAAVLVHADISPENKVKMIDECEKECVE